MGWLQRLQTLKEQKPPSVAVEANELFPDLHDHLSRYARYEELEDDARKALIIETRNALRYGNFCLSIEESRQAVQESAVLACNLHESLCNIIIVPSQQSETHSNNGDPKCRLFAARMMSNLVTANAATARCVMDTVALSPSAEEVSNSIRNTVSDSLESNTVETPSQNQVNWVDMMLGCARTGNRDALGATVAALHNAVSILDEVSSSSTVATKLANDQLLMSTLLRLMLPTKTTLDNSNQKSAADSATEWISLLLEHLSRLGLLPQIYTSVGATIVTPEHVVLLHCMSAAVDEWLESPTSTASPHPFAKNGTDLAASHFFLAEEASRIRTKVTDADATTTDASELALSKSALIVILEILATSLGSDKNESLGRARVKLGADSAILSNISHDLATMVDTLLKANHTTKARDLTLTDYEQRWITTLVRLMGNLSYRCRFNQDALRELEVPLAGATEVRTALHVMLSCTSLAPGCFTLREWAIVALRNVLEGNEKNQALVEKLEAQQPLQSTELENMGLRVDMDRRGQVKIVPKDPPPASQSDL